MTKITFVNGSQPALNATNLNQMQTNIENAFKKTTLWSNTSNTNFAKQTISLSSTDFNFLIIYSFRNKAYDNRTLATIIEKNQTGEIIYVDYFDSNLRLFNRQLKVSNGTIEFSDATINSTTNNTVLIPYKIVGCKY